MIAGREGAISVVLSVLKKHVSSKAVCNSACGALRNITFTGVFCDLACDAVRNITVNDGMFDYHP